MWKEGNKLGHDGQVGLLNLIPRCRVILTAGLREAQLVYEMSTQRPVREAAEELTGVRRWLQNVYEQRRRFATVAAAALALGVGYHVVFGQNGLTAYEKKKQDAYNFPLIILGGSRMIRERSSTRRARSCTTRDPVR